MLKKIIQIATLIGAVAVFAACGQKNAAKSDTTSDKIEVVATFYPMYEFTKEVVGDEGNVKLLIPAGTEPHDYEPSAKDMAKISDSDALVFNSKALEKWAGNLDSIDTKKTVVIEAAKDITLEKDAEEDNASDPHVWLDPVLAEQEVKTITAQLSKKFPKKAKTFAANRDKYVAKLQALDQAYKTAFEQATKKSFVTQHAAFGYLAKQYGLTQEAISGLSPEEEPTASRLAELKHYVEDKQIQYIYFEENTTSKVASTLAKETGVKTAVLNPIEGISTKEIKKGATYLTVMEDNLKSLQKTVK